MTFFHMLNCAVLAYAPYVIAYKYSGINEYTNVWKCAQASMCYMLSQLAKLLLLATFFPATDGDEFALLPEFMKNSADVVDVVGLHLCINYVLTGKGVKGEVRVLTSGLGWGAAHSLAVRALQFWVGARGTAFNWRWIQSALDSNSDLVFYVSMAALVWLRSRMVASSEVSFRVRAAVNGLLAFCTMHVFVYQVAAAWFGFAGWTMVSLRALASLSLGLATLGCYAGMHAVKRD